MIRTSGLHYTYPGGTRALNGISLEVPAGAFLAVMGANGSGKSTLLKHINGLLEAASGSVSVGGIDVGRRSFEAVNRMVGFVFQDPNDQIFAPTVRDDIAYGPRNLGLSEDEVELRLARAASEVGIADFLDRPIHHLSYGQKKRLSIAGVLAMEPEVLVLDEPTASLDPAGERRVLEILLELNRKGMTVVMATHDVDLVPVCATTVCLLDAGRAVARGSLKEVFADGEIIRACGLRLPRVASLFEDLPGVMELPLTVGMAREMLVGMIEKQMGITAEVSP